MLSFLKIPKIQLTITLLFIYLSSIRSAILPNFYLLLMCVGLAIFFDLLFTFLRRRTLFMPWAALVTGLIIGLIIDPKALWYQVAIICVLAMASKNFLRIGGKHIFNPAATGLFLGGVIFNLPVSWWGGSFQNITLPNLGNFLSFAILLLPAYVSVWRLRRFGSILSFLLIYGLFSRFSLLFDPTTIFFALVMLPEPMTSPFDLKKQIFYGTIVAAAALILSRFPIFPDVLVPALLLGNVFNFFK